MCKSDRWIPSELKLIPIIMLCVYVCTPIFLLGRSNGKETTHKNSASLIRVNFYLRRSAFIPDMGM